MPMYVDQSPRKRVSDLRSLNLNHQGPTFMALILGLTLSGLAFLNEKRAKAMEMRQSKRRARHPAFGKTSSNRVSFCSCL